MTTSFFTRREILAAMAASAALAACGRGREPGPDSLGIAVVGIGWLSQGQVIPALQQTTECHLAALVSSTRDKLQGLGKKFGVPETAQYTYDEFDRIADNPDIGAVYIALPNALHAEYTVRAAAAGKHVLCEKPLAVSVEEATQMIAACDAASTRLGTAYRLAFDPHHLALFEMGREERFGAVNKVTAEIGFPIGDDWRLNPKLAGGGVLLEQGVYAINAARNIVGEMPTAVSGEAIVNDTERFADVEETVRWTMSFAGGAEATCATSYTESMDQIAVDAANGQFGLSPAWGFKGLRGESPEGSIRFKGHEQFETMLDEFARRVKQDLPLEGISAEEGLRDLQIAEAIYASAATQSSVNVS